MLLLPSVEVAKNRASLCRESNRHRSAVPRRFFSGNQAFSGKRTHDAAYISEIDAKIPAELSDEQMVLLADIASTGFSGAESGGVRIGDAVVVFAQGPIGLCSTAGAKLMGASLVIVISMAVWCLGSRTSGCASDASATFWPATVAV